MLGVTAVVYNNEAILHIIMYLRVAISKYVAWLPLLHMLHAQPRMVLMAAVNDGSGSKRGGTAAGRSGGGLRVVLVNNSDEQAGTQGRQLQRLIFIA